MNKRGVAVAVSVLALMLAGIIYAVISLYSETKVPEQDALPQSACDALLRAVPSDAALLFCFDGSRSAQRIAADSSGLLRAVIAPTGDAALMRYLSRAGLEKTVISFHNSGALVPLVVTELPHADSLRLAPYRSLAADAALSLSYDAGSGLLVASRSESLVGAALRHLSDGYSVLESNGFPEALASVKGSSLMLLNGTYSTQLYQMYIAPARRKHADLARSFAVWVALGLDEVTPDRLSVEGSASTVDRSYLRIFTGKTLAEPSFPEVVPASARAVVSLVIPSLDRYLEGYGRFTDARDGNRHLDEAWVRQLEVREAATAVFPDGNRILFVRPGKEVPRRKGVYPDPHAAELSSVFGGLFRSGADTLCLQTGKWLAYGTEPALALLDGATPLKSLLSSAGISLPAADGLVGYASLSGTLLSDLLSKPLGEAMQHRFQDGAYVPAVFSAGADGGKPVIRIKVEHQLRESDVPEWAAAGDTAVVVPSGPFKVKNSATGKENTLYQNAHLSICLRDENGKDQWGVPFREPFCGRVETIDYYANGRLQFLFAAGSKLYLIDRLGRFVTGFPADLGKEVLLGPDVYDFTGAHGYRAMVLHKDNTLSLYNLHGQKAENWTDIRPDAAVKGLPEYVDGGDGRHYWVVPTAAGPCVYDFGGGEPLPKKQAAKILKRTKTNG